MRALVVCGLLTVPSLLGSPRVSAHYTRATTTITYAFWGSNEEAKSMRQMIATFAKAHPDIQVNGNWIQSDYVTKIQTLIASGTAPDVLQISDGDLPGFVRAFLPVKLDPAVYATPKLVQYLTVKGVTYATPLIAKPKVMAINKDLFRQYHVSIPSATVPLTPPQYQADAIALTHGSGQSEVYGSAPLWDGNVFPQFGARFFSSDGMTCTIDSPQGIAAGQFIVDSVNKYHYAPTAAASNGQDMLQWFFSKRVGFIPDFGPWNIPLMRPIKDIDWDVVPEFGKAVQMEVDGLAISKSSQNQAAAQTFVTFMSTNPAPQNALGASPAASGVPVILASVNAFEKQIPGKNLAAYVQAMINSNHAGVPAQYSNQAWNLLGKEVSDMTAVGTGSTPPSVAFPKIAKDVTKLIHSGHP
jgi:multiple sugar transport system substrate-binding protein